VSAQGEGAVELREPGARATIAAQNIYFAFASGRLSYDCKTCGSKCCRGFGYVSSIGPELRRQLEMRGALPLFISAPPEDSPERSRTTAHGSFWPAI
jgi:hypothetical protein